MKRYSAGKSSNVRLNLTRTCREHIGPNKAAAIKTHAVVIITKI